MRTSSCYDFISFLGSLSTSGKKENPLRKIFQLLQKILPPDALGGKKTRPKVIMSDNCDERRSSLKKTWSESKLLLDIFLILQQVWRWLFEKKYGSGKMTD